MVSVGNVECVHLFKLGSDGSLVSLVADNPELVAESVDGRHEVVDGSLCGILLAQCEQHGARVVGQEDGLDVGRGGAHVLHAVFFLVGAGEFVLLDDALHVVGHGGANDPAVLRLAVHGLGVEVVAVGLVGHEPSLLLELLELLGAAFVDAGVVFAGAFGEVDFGLDDVVERHLVVAGLSAGFFGTEHVVGAALYLFDQLFGGAQATEGLNLGHSIGLEVRRRKGTSARGGSRRSARGAGGNVTCLLGISSRRLR